MKQETLDMTNRIEESSSNRTRAGLAWSAGLALTLALALISGWQLDALSPSAKAALADYLEAIGTNELSPFQ